MAGTQNMVKKIWVWFLLSLVLLPIIFIGGTVISAIIFESKSLGNGFNFMNSGRYDYFHIHRNEKTIIESAIVDIAQVDHIVAGIRLPRCSNTHPQKIILSNKIAYFILNTKTGVVIEPHSKSEFFNALKNYGLEDKVNLDFDMLNRLRINYYKGYNSIPEQLEYCNNIEYKHLTK